MTDLSPLPISAPLGGDSAAPPPAALGARVRSAIAWRWGGQVLAQIITWGSTLMVVRLLDPRDYGLFAMTQVVFVALTVLNGYSFATSLVQAREVDERRIGQVFALLLLSSAALAIAQLALAPVVARYYGQPAIADLLRVQALVYFTTPFIALPSTLLQRRLEFRVQAIVSTASAIVAAVVAFGFAWAGWGVWALVLAPIAGFAFRAVGLTIAARVAIRPVFDWRGTRDLVTFGGALTLCQILWIVQSQSDVFIAGRAFDPHDLGLYTEALFLTLIVTGRFLPPINEVAFPAYAELHQEGRALAEPFLRTSRTVALVTAPIYIGLALTAGPAIDTLFGPKWHEMAPIAAGLALAMPAMALQIVCSPATNGMGRPRIYLLTSLAGAILMPTAFFWGIAAGPFGLVHAWWIAAPALLLVTLALTLPAVGLSPRRYAAALAPIALACGVMALAVVAVERVLPALPAPLTLALLAASGAAAYGATLWLGWRPVVSQTIAMMRKQPLPASGPARADRTTTTADPAAA